MITEREKKRRRKKKQNQQWGLVFLVEAWKYSNLESGIENAPN